MSLNAIATMHAGMDYHLARQNLLTANLAHVDTPNYRPRELYRVQSFDEVLAGRLAVTDSAHIGASNATPADWQAGIDRFGPIKPDGNGVSLDREAVKIASNNLRYDALATLVQNNMGMLSLASRDAR